MTNLIKRFAQDEDGATAIEYGLIAALIAVAVIGALTKVQGSLDTNFTTISGEIDKANASVEEAGTEE